MRIVALASIASCLLLLAPTRTAAQGECSPPSASRESAFAGVPWPGGDVPYEFAPSVTASQQSAMLAAMQEIENLAFVDFRPRTGEADYVRIEDSSVNSSPVGMVGGMQRLRIADWNMRYAVEHQLFHVLGFWHEHQRPDRDTYVTIQWVNVDPAQTVYFRIVPTANSLGGAYDFDSVMHFGSTEGSINGQQTITVDPPNQAQQSNIGQRTHLSTQDVAGLVAVYGSAIPPAITSVSPAAVPSWQPPTVTITGQRLDEVSAVRFGSAMITTFNVTGSTQLTFAPPTPFDIGNYTLTVESQAGASNGVPFQVTGNVPPVLVVPGVMVRGFSSFVEVHSDDVNTNLVLAALANQPSTVPGVVSLGIGNQFSLLVQAAPPAVADPRGVIRWTIAVPTSLPSGTMLYFQSVLYDLNNLTIPVPVSNVVPVRLF